MAAASTYRITSLISDDHGREGAARAIAHVTADGVTISFYVEDSDTLEVIAGQTRAERRLLLTILETMSRQLKRPA